MSIDGGGRRLLGVGMGATPGTGGMADPAGTAVEA